MTNQQWCDTYKFIDCFKYNVNSLIYVNCVNVLWISVFKKKNWLHVLKCIFGLRTLFILMYDVTS